LIGVNLLREGLDLPEVSLVAVLDADKEGFLRSNRSLTQTAGRAARNVNGRVIFYADKITNSMQQTMDETDRRRVKQMDYNKKHGLEPKQIVKGNKTIFEQSGLIDKRRVYSGPSEESQSIAADPVVKYMSKEQLQKAVMQTQKKMEKAAKELDFMEAARLRDEMFALKELVEKA
jgi:excinuclease ABC subunit B